jgi:hypothetical protein
MFIFRNLNFATVATSEDDDYSSYQKKKVSRVSLDTTQRALRSCVYGVREALSLYLHHDKNSCTPCSEKKLTPVAYKIPRFYSNLVALCI